MTEQFSKELRQRLIEHGLWDFYADQACVGWQDHVDITEGGGRDAFSHLSDDINEELADRSRALTDEELRTLWRISHEDYLVYARAIELAHGISRV